LLTLLTPINQPYKDSWRFTFQYLFISKTR